MPSSSAGEFRSGALILRDAALFIDLYELTMAAAFLREKITETATFSLFARRLPPDRGFIVAAGLEDVLEYVRSFRFTAEGLAYLRSLDRFEAGFLEFLGGLRFTGEIRAVAEGTVVFPDEPLLEVTAPLIEAQLLETALLNICHLQSVLASKAARVTIAARGRGLA
jgi:nicotinate phosphoribosyltransferase